MSFKKMLCMLLSATMIATSVTPALAGEGETTMVDNLKDNVILQFDFDDLVTHEDGTKTTTATIAKYKGKQLPEEYRQARVYDRVSIDEEKGVAVFEGGSYVNTGQHGIVFEPYSPSDNETVGDAYDPMKELTGANTTISAWVTTNYDVADAANYRTLFAYEVSTDNGSGNRTGLQLPLVDGNSTVFFRVKGSGNNGYKMNNIPGSVKSGKRQLYTYVEKAGEAAKLYIDGELVKEEGQKNNVSLYNAAAADTKIDTGVSDWYKYYIGVGPDQTANDVEGKGDRVFKGEMDSLTIYNKALSADEIADLYNEDELIIAQKEAEAKAEADKKAADAVIALIDELPATADIVKGEDDDQIKAARTAYEKLTEDQKALVPAEKVTLLGEAEDMIAETSIEDAKEALAKAIDSAKAIKEAGNKADETTGNTKWTEDSWKVFDEAYKAAEAAKDSDDADVVKKAAAALNTARLSLVLFETNVILDFDFGDYEVAKDEEGNELKDENGNPLYKLRGKTGDGRIVYADGFGPGIEFKKDDILQENVIEFTKKVKSNEAGIIFDPYTPGCVYDPDGEDGPMNPYNPSDPMASLKGKAATVSLWVRVDGEPFNSSMFTYGSYKNDNTGLGASFQLLGRQGSAMDVVYYRNQNGTAGGDNKLATNKPSPYAAGQWTNIVYVEDGNRRILYSNGEVIGQKDIATEDRYLQYIATDKNFYDKYYIGCLGHNEANDTSFYGSMSKLTVYNEALDQETIRAMYEEKKETIQTGMLQELENLVAEIPSVEELTLDKKDAVKDARTAYNNLTDEQKASDPEKVAELLATIEAAEKRIEVLEAKAKLAEAVAAQGEKAGNGQDDYTDASWKVFEDAYDAASNPYDPYSPYEPGDFRGETVSLFEGLIKRLADAVEGLFTKTEETAINDAKAALKTARDGKEAAYNAGNDEYDSWNTFEKNYKKAEEILAIESAVEIRDTYKKDAGSKGVAAYINDIAEKLTNWTPKKTAAGEARIALRAAIEAAKATYEAGNANSKYTADSWTAFTKAYTDAEGKLDSKSATTMKNAAKALTDAQAALKENSNNNKGDDNNGGEQTPVLTEDEQAIVKELGVTSEVAQDIYKVAAEMKIDKATLYITEKDITSVKKNTDIKGTDYAKMQVKVAKQDKKSAKLSWKKVKGADGYIVYGAKADKKAKFKKLTDTTKLSYTQKNLKKATAYKYIVVAYKNVSGTKVTVAASKTVYTITKGGKNGVAKKIAFTNVKKSKVTVKVKKTFTLKTKETKADKKIKNIVKVRYESSNPKVATVSSKGKIKGIKKGTATIYAYTQNGMVAKVNVTVKK